jgi:lipid-binding SYLF domain-containing protein
VFSILLEIENFIFSCSFLFFLYPYQAGGELTDFIIVLRTTDAVKTFSGNIHLSVGAGLSAAVGIVGRAAEADVRAGDGGYAACYTYSCSKGA